MYFLLLRRKTLSEITLFFSTIVFGVLLVKLPVLLIALKKWSKENGFNQ
jgi:uncharacterized membrane protein